MRMLSMTATFGKLEHRTLTLEPGLNVISAPNEWGKSTWCAFLTAMLYGIDTRAKSTKTALADKERYAPWSGRPMSGRMDIRWRGRNITIERRTKGRIPLGDFRAYETDTGLPVQELTAANCGEVLLGVERSVFTRSGFIRLSDLPVTRDDALLSRLNALVTTGDESGDGERLARGLKELRNRCRYNRTGLLPQAEAEKEGLEQQLRELDELHFQQERLDCRLEEIGQRISRLENHRDHLLYAAARADADRVELARAESRRAAEREAELRQHCEKLPDREQAQWAAAKLEQLRQGLLDLEMDAGMLSEPEAMDQPPQAFRGMSAAEAVETARRDAALYESLTKKKTALVLLGLLATAAGGALALKYRIPGLVCAMVGALLLAAAWIGSAWRKSRREKLEAHYGSQEPDRWRREADAYGAALEKYQAARGEYQAIRDDLDRQKVRLMEKINRCTQGRNLEECLREWQGVLRTWDDWADAYRERQKAENHLQTLSVMAKSAKKPEQPSGLNYTETETARLLSDALAERQQIQNRLSQYRGRLEVSGDREAVTNALDRVNDQIARLEDIYAASTLALQTLEETVLALQRRFAPRIAHRAQELMEELTGGRYTRLSLGEGLTLRAGAAKEDTLYDALWRSEGTVDQLYLALRLAVAETLTPEAPLVLDDALARFDDTRMKAAMGILRREAEKKQVILFTCQEREKEVI